MEIGWFIARPVWFELRSWWQRRGELRWNRRSGRTTLLLALVTVVMAWPWQATVRAPGVLGAQQAQALYVPHPARLTNKLPAPGQSVRAGETLAQLDSPELALRLALAQARERQLQWQLSQQPFDPDLMEAGPALQKRWESAAAEVAGLQRELERLSLSAPFAGQVVDVADDAHVGSWLGASERLVLLIGPEGTKADVFVDEASLADVAEGQEASFVPTTLEEPVVHCSVVRKDPVQLGSLDAPGVASVYGGAIPAQRAPDGRLLPLHPVFRVRLEGCDRDVQPRTELIGTGHLHGERRSVLGRALRWILAVWQRESAF